MTKKYVFGMLAFFFLAWAVIVDNAVLPHQDRLKQDVGIYSRYRVSKQAKSGPLKDELIIYAVVQNKQQLYYMDYTPQSEWALESLEQGVPVQLRYANGFPKVWKPYLYEVHSQGVPVVSYSSFDRAARQKEVWKVTGMIGGAFIILFLVGLIKKPKKRKN